ncbi:hypothetical protein EU528_10835 [Candidatus Thorarchaeota archaeon]|nr:MAG: hypothetical protein EU528_10835 [Candidatus Thorarchaeota archaeon]
MVSISKRIGVTFLIAVFTVALVSTAQVSALKPLRFETASSVNLPPWDLDNPSWIGDVWTENGEHGAFYWFNEGAEFLGPEEDYKVQKFWGIWWIDWDDGDHIQGTHVGSFNYAISQYTINGRVSVATGDWSYLVGRKIHTIGIVDWTGGIYGIGYSESIFQIN